MEATEFSEAVWQQLEGHFELLLANTRQVKTIAGRKTDVADAV